MRKKEKERFSLKRKFSSIIENCIRRFIEKEQWSPEQILGYFQNNGYNMVSIERIYQYITKDKQQGGTLHKHMRHRLKHRKRPGKVNFYLKYFSVVIINDIRCSEAFLVFGEHGIEIDNIDLDYNINPEYKSNKLVSAAVGYVKSLGFKARVKPELLPAVYAADHIVS